MPCFLSIRRPAKKEKGEKMVSRKTQKDVGNFKAKLVGPLTTRQVVFVGLGVVVDFLAYSVLKGAGLDMNTIAPLCLLVMAPFAVFGSCFPYGMTCEEFLYQYYIYHIVAPPVREYCTHTALDDIKPEMTPEEKKKDLRKKKKMSKHTEIKGYRSFE